MQRLKKCLGIDIGTSTVKLVELATEKTGVCVLKMLRADTNLPPGPMDAERANVLSKIIKDLISANKISTKQAVFSVPGQSVFIRRIRFPRTSEDRLHRIVAYEARQQIPFALENSLMEYQVFDYGDTGEVEVLLVALKKDVVNDFMKLINKLGLKPLMISVSSLALFNFHVFDSTPYEDFLEALSVARGNEPKKEEAKPGDAAAKKKGFSFNFSFGKKKKLDVADVANAQPVEAEDEAAPEVDFGADLPEDFYEEVKAYINVGAQTFDLAIARHGKRKMLGFTRSVPWAGNELNRMLVDKMRLGSPAEAEEIKRERAIAVLPGREDEASAEGLDPHASEFVAQWADRMILEIRKSFDFYIAQPDGMAVDNIVMSGGQAQQRNLSAYVEEKLGIPVDVRVVPENAAVQFGPGVSSDEAISYVVAMGLALTGVGLGQVTVDFLPTELKTIREFKKKNVELLVMGAALLAMIAIGSQTGSNEMSTMKSWLDANQGKLDRVAQDRAQIEKARTERSQINDRITAIGQSLNDRLFWLEFLGMLESVKPPTILVTSISMNPDGKVDLYGETAESVSSIAAFNDALKEQKEWVSSSNIVYGPADGYSAVIRRPVTKFGLQLQTFWKETRLAAARSTLAPGQYTPTPTPAGQPGATGVVGPGAGGAGGAEQYI